MTINRQKIRDLLTLEKFEAWIKGFSPEAEIGRPRDRCNCPIALYIAGTGELKEGALIEVEDALIYVEDDFNVYPVFVNSTSDDSVVPRVPDWISEFTRKIDCMDDVWQRVITAKEAQEIIDRIKTKQQTNQ